ncbi:MAG: carboxypeptidase regulatory-like domain-containing protein, partial [Blastocatellia bacterium]|nr:carboxypeptidase regulatory-like domain-containing protein [Blastocatellia bacterium]
MKIKKYLSALVPCLLCALSLSSSAQSLGSAGTVSGTVVDPNQAVVKGATVVIQNSVTGYRRAVNTDSAGVFRFTDVPPNNYMLTVTANDFNTNSQSIIVRSLVPISLNILLTVGGVNSSVEVTSAENLIENVPTTHTDVDKTLIDRLPVRSAGSGLSDVVTFAAPGVAADSNGFFHPLGDHAQSQISFDNQPITDQSSKAFSTQ